MIWKKNVNYIKARDNFLKMFTANQLPKLHSNLPKIAFICGGNEKEFKNRHLMEKYFKKHIPRFLTFRAENAWDSIRKSEKDTNALELEGWLADFSDVVIILVESFGTVAELGAFSMNNALRKKLLPILHHEFKDEQSFINTGPIKWIDKDSKYSPTIYCDYNIILSAMGEVQKRINKRYWDNIKRNELLGEYRFSYKVFLFFLVYLIGTMGPIETNEIFSITKELLQIENNKQIRFVLSVGVALGIFSVVEISERDYYSCIDYEKLFNSAESKVHFNKIQKCRAQNLSSLLKIDKYKEVLNMVVQDD